MDDETTRFETVLEWDGTVADDDVPAVDALADADTVALSDVVLPDVLDALSNDAADVPRAGLVTNGLAVDEGNVELFVSVGADVHGGFANVVEALGGVLPFAEVPTVPRFHGAVTCV